jgi:hypothetical protein
MRIDLSTIDREQFILKAGIFCGLPGVLVTPAMQGTQWTQANKHLRSSIWSHEGLLLSAGFPKFTNAGENPEHFPMPASLDNALCVEKLDGSLAIFDYLDDTLSCRTRGTFSATTLDNAADFAHAIEKYPGVRSLARHHRSEFSWLFEITTPNQRIVIDYGAEIGLTLIGGIRLEDYQLVDQKTLDRLAFVYDLKRPRYFTFSSIDHLLADVKTWEGLEGCVIYSRAGMHKCKADSYLRAHRFKERVTIPNLLDIWQTQGQPRAEAFKAALTRDYDHECMVSASVLVDQIDEAYGHVIEALAAVEQKTKPLRALSRRDAALAIQANIPKIYQGAAFSMLSDKPVEAKHVRRLMEFELEKV